MVCLFLFFFSRRCLALIWSQRQDTLVDGPLALSRMTTCMRRSDLQNSLNNVAHFLSLYVVIDLSNGTSVIIRLVYLVLLMLLLVGKREITSTVSLLQSESIDRPHYIYTSYTPASFMVLCYLCYTLGYWPLFLVELILATWMMHFFSTSLAVVVEATAKRRTVALVFIW